MILSLALACGIGAAAMLSDTERASAANIRSLEMTDDFESSELNPDAWSTTNGVNRALEYSALRLNGINTWGSWVLLQKSQLSEEWESFTIEMEMNWVGSPSWSGIFFGNTNPNGFFYASPSSYFIQMHAGYQEGDEDGTSGDRGLRLGARDVSTNTGFFGTPDTTEFHPCNITAQGNLLAEGKVQRVIMEFTQKPETAGTEDVRYDFSFTWGNAEDDESTYQTIVFDSEPHGGVNIGGYMGFTTYGETVMEIRSFALSTGTGADKQAVFEDDFSDTTISFPSFTSTESNWRGVGTNIESRTYCGEFCTVSYNGVANGSLVYNVPISRNAASLKSFEISYDISLVYLTQSTYIGSGFGLESTASDAASASFIGLRRTDGGYALAYISGGKIVEEVAVTIAGTSITMSLVGYSDNRVVVTLGERQVAFSDVEFDGYTSVSAVTLDGSAAPENNASIDNFSLYVYSSIVPSGNDVGINFQGASSFELAGEIIEEHYVNTRKWVMYGGVELPMQMSRSYVQFHNIGGNAAFLSRTQFGDHIARFDFRPSSFPDLSDSELAGFGYSFGRPMADTSANDAPGIFFRKNGDTTQLIAKNMTGQSNVTCSLNVFEETEEDTWYTCMIIISSRTVKVFLKEASAPDSSFGAPQAVYTDVDTYGYAAMTIEPTGTAYFYATNYSVTNIDPMIGREV